MPPRLEMVKQAPDMSAGFELAVTGQLGQLAGFRGDLEDATSGRRS